MSSEHLASAKNPHKGDLGGSWNILDGASAQYTDLGIARRFGGAAGAYSLRDIGAINNKVVKVRRDSGEPTDPEENFSANQVQGGALEDWVNGKVETTLPADVATAAAAYSLRKVKASYSGDAVRIRRSSDDIEVDVAFDSDGKVSASSAITNVAEQGGESGQTTDTTLGDFISGTDAFVHTWYDQAGSKDAVQATAANQPKIAESGALLADGIDFDGSNDFLQTSTQVLTGTETGANSMYAVIKQTSGDAGYICGSAASPDGASNQIGQSLYGASNDKIVLTDGNDATATGTLDTITRIEGSYYLVSSNYSNNNTNTLHSNANANGYANGSGAYDFNAGDRFTIGARKDSTSAAAVLFTGSMKEIIAYDSDQSDNRFKIESNINNYYGLYNDANDLAGNFTVDSSGTGTNASISNESKTGFTATVVDKAGFFGADLNEAVPNGSNLYISFIANLSPSGGTAATPNFGLADSSDKTGNSTGNPLDTAVTEGFNSITVAGTSSTCDRIRFTEGNDNVSFIISDLKVSRIARNGFVETWYDQSGNDEDMLQSVAASQPTIVKNGGQVKSSNGFPAITFADNAVHLERAEFLTGQLGGYFIVGNTLKADQDGTDAQVLLRQGQNYRIAVELINAGNVRSFLRDGAGDNGDARTSSNTVGDDSIFLNTTIVGARGTSGLINYLNGGDESTDDITDVEDVDFTSVDTGNISFGSIPAGTFDYKGELMEVILFNTNVSSDRTTIETEINNHYNIY